MLGISSETMDAGNIQSELIPSKIHFNCGEPMTMCRVFAELRNQTSKVGKRAHRGMPWEHNGLPRAEPSQEHFALTWGTW